MNENGLVTAVTAGTATITVTTADGGFTAQCAVTVSARPLSAKAEAAFKLAVYPNLAGAMLYITDKFVGLVEIYDLNGTLLLTSTSNVIDIGSLPAGVYVVKADGKSAKVTKQ